MQSIVFQAQKAGFSVGTFITAKGAEAPEIWILSKYDGSSVTLERMEHGRRTDDQVVAVAQLLEDWRVHKGVVTALLPGWDPVDSPCSPLSSSLWKFELAKGAINIPAPAVPANLMNVRFFIPQRCVFHGNVCTSHTMLVHGASFKSVASNG